MPRRPPLNQPEEGCQLGRKQEGKIQSLHTASQVWLPRSQRKKRCDPFKKHSGRGGVEGSPACFKEGKFLLGDSPQPKAEFLQPAGPLLHPVGVQGCRLRAAAPPLSILPSSWDRKVSVALTRPLDLRSCSQNNPPASPASFKAGRGVSNWAGASDPGSSRRGEGGQLRTKWR